MFYNVTNLDYTIITKESLLLQNFSVNYLSDDRRIYHMKNAEIAA